MRSGRSTSKASSRCSTAATAIPLPSRTVSADSCSSAEGCTPRRSSSLSLYSSKFSASSACPLSSAPTTVRPSLPSASLASHGSALGGSVSVSVPRPSNLGSRSRTAATNECTEPSSAKPLGRRRPTSVPSNATSTSSALPRRPPSARVSRALRGPKGLYERRDPLALPLDQHQLGSRQRVHRARTHRSGFVASLLRTHYPRVV